MTSFRQFENIIVLFTWLGLEQGCKSSSFKGTSSSYK